MPSTESTRESNCWSHSQTITGNYVYNSLSSFSPNGCVRCAQRALLGNTAATIHCNIHMPWSCPRSLSAVPMALHFYYFVKKKAKNTSCYGQYCPVNTEAWNQQLHKHMLPLPQQLGCEQLTTGKDCFTAVLLKPHLFGVAFCFLLARVAAGSRGNKICPSLSSKRTDNCIKMKCPL